jgi:hypothetical protein
MAMDGNGCAMCARLTRMIFFWGCAAIEAPGGNACTRMRWEAANGVAQTRTGNNKDFPSLRGHRVYPLPHPRAD